jgi:hypothetical protein
MVDTPDCSAGMQTEVGKLGLRERSRRPWDEHHTGRACRKRRGKLRANGRSMITRVSVPVDGGNDQRSSRWQAGRRSRGSHLTVPCALTGDSLSAGEYAETEHNDKLRALEQTPGQHAG